MAFSKARRLSDLVSSTGEISSFVDASITHADLHTNMDLTGKTVLVSTQSASDNDTSAASTAYVTTAISNLVDSAPGTMNTLNEIAAALNDDANFNTTVTNAIAAKLPLAGGTMTGHLDFGDNIQVRLGTGTDFLVYHDGTNSRLASAAHPIMTSSTIVQFLSADTTETMLKATQNGSVELYHNNSKKIETAAGGITVTGTLNGISTTKSASGNRWGILPEVESNGVMEIGRYLDFHVTDGDTSDYSARFDYDGSKMILTSPLNVSGNLNVAGQGDFSSLVYVGNNNTELSENNLRFRSGGAAYIDHNTVGQSVNFRVSSSSSNDTTALSLASNGYATFYHRINPSEHIIFQSNNGYLQFPAASGGAWAMASHGGNNVPGTQGTSLSFHHWNGSAWNNEVEFSTDGDITMDGLVRAGVGSAAVPTFSFGSDTNTGMYRPASDNLGFVVGGSQKVFLSTTQLNISVTTVPGTDNTYDLGSQSARWRNVYTTDLQLSNEDTGGNDVDGTEGNWTLQEGETDLYIINNKSGKKYKFALEEIE